MQFVETSHFPPPEWNKQQCKHKIQQRNNQSETKITPNTKKLKRYSPIGLNVEVCGTFCANGPCRYCHETRNLVCTKVQQATVQMMWCGHQHKSRMAWCGSTCTKSHVPVLSRRWQH